MSQIADRIISDVGLENGVAALTPERIEAVVNQMLKGETGAKLKAYNETCMRCGLCSQGCHYYMSHDNDPSYSPVNKATETMYELMEKKGKVSPQRIYEMAQMAYTECNLCKRCAHYCPIGIDTGYIMSMVRRICYLLDVVPQYIRDTSHSHSSTMNQMWVKDDEWIDTLQWQEDEARDEFPDLRIPVDKEGADFMYSVIAPEPKFRTQLIYQAAAIMNAAGCNWTMPSHPGWDNSDMCMFVGDFENMGRLKRAHYEVAQKLRVKRIVMGECGHAFRSVYDMGNRWLGHKKMPIPVIHSIDFFWELIDEGKVNITHKYEKPVTIQDPCNIIRGRGLMDKLRDVVHFLCEEVVEMTPNREHNYCCCAGGGVINCGPPFKNTRMTGNRIKAEQLEATGVKDIVIPCHNCHGGIEDIIGYYDLGMHGKFIGDIMYELMVKPEL
ncbi:electron transfer complex ferredoxin TmcB [Pseudodesulfovibrio sediminis]|uniref:Ferredoxin n=1 Tax=Pseudodesulfovibrio sediminis TaxID=2810563 RepID=A0ABN6EY05_9BACT|nr:(Fe-S)-binding protein [Pseudodesulfovibrio sediminis]BCS89713.1 ferredoxin [Pseudodesulfovibrio sediminis]